MDNMTLAQALSGMLVFPAFLLLARVGGAIMVFPAVSDPSINMRVRMAIVAAVTMILYPLLRPTLPAMPDGLGQMSFMLLGEVYVGILLGLGARLMMAALSYTGEMIAFMAGFQGASLFDPTSGANTAAPTILLTLMASLLILVLNLHHQLIMAVVESYRAFPPGQLPAIGDVNEAFIQIMAELTKLGVQLAAPVVVAGLLSNALFGVMNRLIPQLQIFFVSVPVSISLGIMVLVAGLGTMMQLWAHATEARLTLFNVTG